MFAVHTLDVKLSETEYEYLNKKSINLSDPIKYVEKKQKNSSSGGWSALDYTNSDARFYKLLVKRFVKKTYGQSDQSYDFAIKIANMRQVTHENSPKHSPSGRAYHLAIMAITQHKFGE